MAIITYKTFLMHKASSTYAKLVDIKDFSDLIGQPEPVEITTLSDAARRYIAGIHDNQALTFTANYTKTDFTTLAALEGTEADYAVYFGTDANGDPDGSDGKVTFKGYLSVGINGGGVNEAVDMTITILPSTEITVS